MTCEGTWRDAAGIGGEGDDEPIAVLRCSGCGEVMAVWRSRAWYFPAGTSREAIARGVLAGPQA